MPWNVVHLHGGRTAADSDGWAENAFLADQSMASFQHVLYTNDQPATMLWYHDHAMAVTRLNVYAGLAGGWIIRDDIEDALKLPTGKYELPLVIQDKNLETDGQYLSGRLLHKVETDFEKIKDSRRGYTGELFAPFTLVNGTIWPRHCVEPKPYRLRVLNGSNARTYELFLVRKDGTIANDLIRQIGSDGGLLPEAVSVADLKFEDGTPKGLILAPAERADLIIDFQRVPGEILTWYNVAASPFDNSLAIKDGGTDPVKPGESSNQNRLRFPEVMQFAVDPGNPQPALGLPSPLVSGSKHWTLDSPELKGHEHVWIALNEQNQHFDPDPAKRLPDILYFNELQEVSAKSGTGFTLDLLPVNGSPAVVRKFMNRRSQFYDAINIQLAYGKPAVWNILNLSADSHPIHIHLVQFQVLARARYTTIPAVDAGGLLPDGSAVTGSVAVAIDGNELGWKDTVRVNPQELVTVAAIFDGYTGRYMYHCHILEHEDMEMMRPFIVLPAEALAFMNMGMDPMPMNMGAANTHQTRPMRRPNQ
jgi:spore coat protein A